MSNPATELPLFLFLDPNPGARFRGRFRQRRVSRVRFSRRQSVSPSHDVNLVIGPRVVLSVIPQRDRTVQALPMACILAIWFVRR